MIKSSYLCFLVLLFFAACKERNVAGGDSAVNMSQPAGHGVVTTYTNPVLDQNFLDTTVIKAPDGFYYVYGTNSDVDGNVINIQVGKSGDLGNWNYVGDALVQQPGWAEKDFWAPHVLYDNLNETYYLYYSGEHKSEKYGKCLGVATSKSPTGPFKDTGEPMLCGDGFVNIDPMAFDDPVTGKKYLYWGSGFEAVKVQELSDDRLGFKEGTAPIELIQPDDSEGADNYQRLVEGAWIDYRENYYYLYYSGDNCCGENAHYAAMVARSKNATGPFETLEEVTGSENNVILERNERWIAPGHNSVITDDSGEDWMVYHAIDATDKSKGRVMLIDKIIYEDGWPGIKTGRTPSIKEKEAPVFQADDDKNAGSNNIYLADPTIFYHEGTYYLYGTSGGDLTNKGEGFLVYTSTDLENWEGSTGATEGFALKKGDAFGDKGFWAPQVFKYEGLFYMAYTANEEIAVATSNSPLGPFINSGKALEAPVNQIDPFIFFDEDGKKYLYHVRLGNGNRIYVAEMNDDLKSIKPETLTECISAEKQWENTEEVEWPVAEGPTVLKRGDLYYLLYSANDFRNPAYAVGYATSKDPLGPWKKSEKNPILNKDLINERGSGHGDILIDENGEMQYVLHTHFSKENVHPRKTAIIKMDFPDPEEGKGSISVAPSTFRFLKSRDR